MKIVEVNNLKDLVINEDISVALGSFDGLHMGHRELINTLKESKLKKAMITFYPNPKAYFSDSKYYYLTPKERYQDLLKNTLDYLIIINFNKKIAKSKKKKFISFLKNNHVKEVIAGYDYTFGSNKEGKIDDLSDFQLTVIPEITLNKRRISSTLIRSLLEQGNVKEANDYLGYKYTIKGEVVSGSQLGRTIGFPTANINQNDYFLPKNGVYVTITKYNGEFYKSMTNIGNNPTFNKQESKRIETYILNLNEDLYGKEIEVLFIDRIRDEVRFRSVEALIDELKNNALYVSLYPVIY